ncbi:Uncharacterised protein [Legionella beliardensis]|uniref:Uncharacterized protein n=1 Tax=Legionella beliardensis TaxID=91822 RepID=A0A378I2B2_9GAMM|nr:hypothetical protein [Legionella beliardensis]STX29133.1 Uncharacterised protein [Legionella beliardensis]
MSEQSENELTGWFSTYGLITAQRILERYRIKLPQEDLLCALKIPDTFYNQLLRLPFRHVFNGIIFQQAQDYQLYAQKLIIDYLLSGESGKEEGSPGTSARAELEKERQLLIDLNKDFHELELEHEKLIAGSQAILIKKAQAWHAKLMTIAKELKKELQALKIKKSETAIAQALTALLCNFNFKDKPSDWRRAEQILGVSLGNEERAKITDKINELAAYTEDSEDNLADFAQQIASMGRRIREFRTDFYNLILRAKDIIILLPNYRRDLTQEAENKESLFFDPNLGDR